MITATHNHTEATVNGVAGVVDAAQLGPQLGTGLAVVQQPLGGEDIGTGGLVGHHGGCHVRYITDPCQPMQPRNTVTTPSRAVPGSAAAPADPLAADPP